jgi:hypothetical protein
MRIIQEVELVREPSREILDIFKMNLQITNNPTSNSSCGMENTNDNITDTKNEGKDQYYDNTVDYRYICIRKEHFDVSMIYLKYTNLKKENYMEIIYKSPSIFLDGLFFKTPPLNTSQLSIFTKNRIPFTSAITCVLDRVANSEFINMLKTIDSYLSNYIVRHARDINTKMHEDENHYLNYETILKPWYNPKKKIGTSGHSREQLSYSTVVAGDIYNTSTSTSTSTNTNTNTRWTGNYVINFKSYLERPVLEALKQSILDKSINNTEKKYVITFNISNIYFSNMALTPLIKCNKCEEVI